MAEIDDYRMADTVPESPVDDGAPPFEPPATRQVTAVDGLPCDVAAEKILLGAALLDVQYLNEMAEQAEADDFFLDSHRRIFLRMCEMLDENIVPDIVTLPAKLSDTKEIEAVGGVAYLSDLDIGLPRQPRIANYIAVLRDKSRLRKLMTICNSAIARAQDQGEPSLSVVEEVEGQLIEIAQSAVSGTLRTVADSVERAGGVDEYMAPIVNPVAMTGVQTGFYDFDSMTGGLKKGELIVIAARPSQGKTGILLNIMQNVCVEQEDYIGALFSLEMSREAMEHRALASIARVDVRRAMSGQFLSSMERDKLQKALQALIESDRLYIDDSPVMTPTQVRAKARRLKQRKGRLDVVGIDYLQLLQPGHRAANRQEEVMYISRSLKAMSKELDCPVVALAQLNRANEGRLDKRPILSDLRESGQIEQDADLVAFIHRDSYYRPDDEECRGLADLLIAKQRNGPTGIVKLAFIPELVRFENLARR